MHERYQEVKVIVARVLKLHLRNQGQCFENLRASSLPSVVDTGQIHGYSHGHFRFVEQNLLPNEWQAQDVQLSCRLFLQHGFVRKDSRTYLHPMKYLHS